MLKAVAVLEGDVSECESMRLVVYDVSMPSDCCPVLVVDETDEEDAEGVTLAP